MRLKWESEWVYLWESPNNQNNPNLFSDYEKPEIIKTLGGSTRHWLEETETCEWMEKPKSMKYSEKVDTTVVSVGEQSPKMMCSLI